MHQGTSFPVGKVNFMDLYPLNFREFLAALGEERYADMLLANDNNMVQMFRDKFIERLKQYYYVGGMSEVVQSFVDDKDYNIVRQIQKELLEYYQQDFSKHAPSMLVPRLNMPVFKIYMNDVGLLVAMSELHSRTIVDGNRIFTEFKGALTEQYVQQQLISDVAIEPYYYSAENARCEVDFVIQGEESVIPIEVKAEENLKAKSLKVFCEKYEIEKGIRVSMSDYREQDWMVNIPLYQIAKLKEYMGVSLT